MYEINKTYHSVKTYIKFIYIVIIIIYFTIIVIQLV